MKAKKRKSHLPPGYAPKRPGRKGLIIDWCRTVAERRKAAFGISPDAEYLAKVALGSSNSAALFRSLWDEPDSPHDLMRDKYGALKPAA